MMVARVIRLPTALVTSQQNTATLSVCLWLVSLQNTSQVGWDKIVDCFIGQDHGLEFEVYGQPLERVWGEYSKVMNIHEVII